MGGKADREQTRARRGGDGENLIDGETERSREEDKSTRTQRRARQRGATERAFDIFRRRSVSLARGLGGAASLPLAKATKLVNFDGLFSRVDVRVAAAAVTVLDIRNHWRREQTPHGLDGAVSEVMLRAANRNGHYRRKGSVRDADERHNGEARKNKMLLASVPQKRARFKECDRGERAAADEHEDP